MTLLSGRNLAKSFGPSRALAGADFDIAPGEVVAVMGPSGSGKSTLVAERGADDLRSADCRGRGDRNRLADQPGDGSGFTFVLQGTFVLIVAAAAMTLVVFVTAAAVPVLWSATKLEALRAE